MIGSDVIIEIKDIRSDSVRIGIQAPACVPVHREEIFNAIRIESAQFPVDDSIIVLNRLRKNFRLAAHYQNLLNDLANDCVTAFGMASDDTSHAAETARSIVFACINPIDAMEKVNRLLEHGKVNEK